MTSTVRKKNSEGTRNCLVIDIRHNIFFCVQQKVDTGLREILLFTSCCFGQFVILFLTCRTLWIKGLLNKLESKENVVLFHAKLTTKMQGYFGTYQGKCYVVARVFSMDARCPTPKCIVFWGWIHETFLRRKLFLTVSFSNLIIKLRMILFKKKKNRS